MVRLKKPAQSKCSANRTRHKHARAALTVLCALEFLWPTRVWFAQVPGTALACEHAVTHVEDGKRLFGQQAYALALQEFRAALDACPQNQAAAAGLTRTYLAARQFSSAEQSALHLLAIDPHSESRNACFVQNGKHSFTEVFSDRRHREIRWKRVRSSAESVRNCLERGSPIRPQRFVGAHLDER